MEQEPRKTAASQGGEAKDPLLRVEDWEDPRAPASLGDAWEQRRPRRRWSNERYRMATLLRKNLLPGQSLVDVGCGPGFYVPYYRDGVGFPNVHLVDQSSQMLAHCRRLYPGLQEENLHQGSIYSLPFPDGRFDVVVNCDVLMHIPNYRKALSELYRICNPHGGRLFLRVNLTDGPTYGDLPREENPDPGYVYWIAYGREEFRKSLADLGLSSVAVIDRICRKPLKRGGDPFIADAAIVVLTRGEPRHPLRKETLLGHLVSKLGFGGSRQVGRD
jgi:SAM-dependent methyltransferase